MNGYECVCVPLVAIVIFGYLSVLAICRMLNNKIDSNVFVERDRCEMLKSQAFHQTDVK